MGHDTPPEAMLLVLATIMHNASTVAKLGVRGTPVIHPLALPPYRKVQYLVFVHAGGNFKFYHSINIKLNLNCCLDEPRVDWYYSESIGYRRIRHYVKVAGTRPYASVENQFSHMIYTNENTV